MVFNGILYSMRLDVYQIAFGVIIGIPIFFIIISLSGFFSVDDMLLYNESVLAFISEHYLLSIILFAALYIFLTAISFPYNPLLLIISGVLFGTYHGFILVFISGIIGSLLATGIIRFAFAKSFEKYFGPRVRYVQRIVEEHYFTSLFILRILPIFPLFLVSIFMGFIKIRVVPYIIATALGTFPMTLFLVHTGQQTADVFSVGRIPSISLLIILIMIILCPAYFKYLLIKKGWYTGKKFYWR